MGSPVAPAKTPMIGTPSSKSTSADDAERAQDAPRETGPPGPDPLELIRKQLAELRAYFISYFEAQKDATKAGFRRFVWQAALGSCAAIVAGTLVIACTVMLTDGLADVVSLAVGGRTWVGKVVVGGGGLLVLSLLIFFYISRLIRLRQQPLPHRRRGPGSPLPSWARYSIWPRCWWKA